MLNYNLDQVNISQLAFEIIHLKNEFRQSMIDSIIDENANEHEINNGTNKKKKKKRQNDKPNENEPVRQIQALKRYKSTNLHAIYKFLVDNKS